MHYIDQAAAIWCAQAEPDSYCSFQNCFCWDGTGTVMLEIAADSTFSAEINGRSLPIQQLADYPHERTFSCCEITEFLQNGDNQILVCVHYIGDNFLTYQIGIPFLQAVVYNGKGLLTRTGPAWECTGSTAFLSGLQCKVSSQLGFVFHCDARREIPAVWEKPAIVKLAGSLRLRTVPQLLEMPVPETVLFNFGILKRCGEKESIAAACMSDFFAPLRHQELFSLYDTTQLEEAYFSHRFRLLAGSRFTFRKLPEFPAADGFYVTGDLGAETVGCFTMEIEAPAGTVIDIAHGEHLDDGRVRASVGRRNFADRCVCKEGLNHFTYRHRRMGARFLELHITGCGQGEVTLRYFGLIPMELPLPAAAAFHCEDRMLLRLNELSVNTLKLCMHEHYEDCPWREQGLYAYDSRNQILYGYYLWGNYDFAAASLDLLGKSFDGERYLALTAPGKIHLTIPVFTMVWIVELYEHWLHSGSPELFRRWQPQIDRILDRALSEKVPDSDAFYHPGDSEAIWNFCEWRGELSRLSKHPQSVYNLYLHEALVAAAKMHQALGRQGRAEALQQIARELGKNLERSFWCEEKGAYLHVLQDKPDKLYEHVQAVMLANGLVPAGRQAGLLNGFKTGSMHEITLSALYYFVSGLLQCGPEGRKLLLARLRNTFEPILLSGASSIWETANGGDDFDAAGSLCHAWSSIMPYFCGRVLLGVRPLAPGFSRFEVNPYCAELTHAEGEIPTPYGKIRVSWQCQNDAALCLQVEHPEGTECVCGPAYENGIATFEDIMVRN